MHAGLVYFGMSVNVGTCNFICWEIFVNNEQIGIFDGFPRFGIDNTCPEFVIELCAQ